MANYEETFEKLVELQHMMGALRHRHAQASGPLADTTRGRGRVLALLKMRDGLSTRDMANVLDIRVSSLNETIARMEAEGLVERRQSEEDGRVMLLFLTDAGREADQPTLDLPRQLLCDFTDDELHVLDGYLDRMRATLQGELGEDWKEHEEHVRQQRDKYFHGEERPRHGGPRDSRGHGGPREAHGHGGDRGRGHGDKREGRGYDGSREGRGHGTDRGRGHGGPRDAYGHGGSRDGRGGDRGRGNGGRYGGPRDHGYGGHGPSRRPNARYDREAEGMACNHDCRACSHSVCLRRQSR